MIYNQPECKKMHIRVDFLYFDAKKSPKYVCFHCETKAIAIDAVGTSHQSEGERDKVEA